MSYTKDELTFSWDVESPLSIHLENEALKTPQFKIPKIAIKTEECSDPGYYSGMYTIIDGSVLKGHISKKHFCGDALHEPVYHCWFFGCY